MTVETTVTFRIMPDPDPDTSWLEQSVWADRLAEYQRGEFYFVGVRASVQVRNTKSGTCTIIASAGLWGIESDSDSEYLLTVGHEELASLADELATRNIDITGIKPVVKDLS